MSIQAEQDYAEGNWHEALQLVEEFIAEMDAGSPHYLESAAHELRGSLRIAFGDREGAAADSKQALEAGRRTGDGQLICAMLVGRARTELDEGRAADAKVLALEALGYGDRVVHILNDAWIVEAAWVMLDLGLADDYRRLVAEHPEIPWARAASAVCSGDLAGAAEVLEQIGYRPGEAYARLRLAKQFVEEGRRAEADEELQRSLAFWREVGATRYVREGEALLAESA
jgi:tetratricopeptide (TPR) repeat protein